MLFGSVAFMLLLGWGADLILGTSPWGLVAGIILGSLIGFVQFFRTSSKLFPGREPVTEVKPLISPPDDDNDLPGPF
jgi:F0F1-type ATP synthase assembly protein I